LPGVHKPAGQAFFRLRPVTVLYLRQELPIHGATNVYIDYDVQPGGDIKVAWALR